MASHLQSLPDDAYLIAVSDVSYFFRMSDLSWIRGNRVPGEVSLDLWELFAGQKGAWAGRDLRILLQEPFARGALVSLLQRRFRGAQCEEVHPAHVPAYRYMSACRIPSPELATGFAGGAHARYFRGDEPAPFLERREPVISYAFVPEVCSFPVGLHKPPCRVEWEGVWRVPHTGEYALRAEARRGRLEVTVDGQAVSPKQKLTAGEHVIRAGAEFVPVRGEHDHTGARLQWRRHAEDPWQFVEFAEFGHDNRAVAVPDEGGRIMSAALQAPEASAKASGRVADRARLAGVVVALVLCGVAQWSIRGDAVEAAVWADGVLVGAAVAAALLLGRPRPPTQQSAPLLDRPRRDFVGAVLALTGFALAAVGARTLADDWYGSFTTAAPLAVLGVAVWSAGLAVRDRRRRPHTRRGVTRWEAVLLLVVVAVGFFMRFHRFDYYPPPDGVCAVEEPQAGQHTFLVMEHGDRPWEFVGDRWLPIPTFHTLGRSLTTLRLPFALVSALTVIAVYLLLRSVVSVPVALFATALSAVCSWNLVYARLAHNIFATNLVVVAVLAMCARVHVRGGLTWYPWIGFLSGYTLYTYAGYRGTGLLVGLFLVLSFAAGVRRWWSSEAGPGRVRARGLVGTQAVGLILAVLGLAVALVPLGGRLQRNPTYFFEAVERSTLVKPTIRGETDERAPWGESGHDSPRQR
jgi:hypothetical protein